MSELGVDDIQFELWRGAKSTLAANSVKLGISDDQVRDLAGKVRKGLVVGSAGDRDLLALDKARGELVRFDIVKAISLISSGLAATISLITDNPTFAAALTVIGALGAVKGLKEPLPSSCARIVCLLLEKKQLDRDLLKGDFLMSCELSGDVAEYEFQKSLELLAQIGSIRVEEDVVKLVERVYLRFG